MCAQCIMFNNTIFEPLVGTVSKTYAILMKLLAASAFFYLIVSAWFTDEASLYFLAAV